ncbi:MAG: hypothetical protein ACE5HS_02510 [bacterium]
MIQSNHKVVIFITLLGCASIFLITDYVHSQPIATKVLVRAISRDAKVIGTKVGGARITIFNEATGKVMAQGIQTGGTGTTEKIMIKPRVRGETVYDTPNTAGFLATLELARPTIVTVVAEGPLEPPQSTYKASKTLLVVPGQDILGEGILLEIHGFRVSLLSPAADAEFHNNEKITVTANITMT